MGKRKYLFFDFDGTVYEGGIYASETVSAMKRVQGAGHWLILNSGRSQGHFETSPEGRKCPIRWDAKIYGMSDILIGDRAVQRMILPPESILKWVEFARRNRIGIQLEGQKNLHPFRFDKTGVFGHFRLLRGIRRAMREDPITELNLLSSYGKYKTPQGEWAIHADHDWFEVTVSGRSKGNAILDFCRLTGADLADCVCFGDAYNDIGMFRICPTGICMKPAPKELSDLAAYHAKSDHGVAEGLEWLFANEKTTEI
ncbi:MAG: HAD family phosphatase [Clostridia bacterium]|nr:HAD family phosphatase [Clostridia bacterium]